MITWILSRLFPPRKPTPLTSEELSHTLRIKAEQDRDDAFYREINAQQRRILDEGRST